MEKVPYSIIKNRKQYHEYCNRHEQLAFSGNRSKTIQDEMEHLEFLIGKWDKEHSIFGDEEMDPISMLRFFMNEHQMQAKDLAVLLDVSKGLVSEILNYKKGLSKENIRILAERFKVRQEAFNKPYELQRVPASQPVIAAKTIIRTAPAVLRKRCGRICKRWKDYKNCYSGGFSEAGH